MKPVNKKTHVKSIIVHDNLIVHQHAKKCYQFLCENSANLPLSTSDTSYIEVIHREGRYYFYNNFSSCLKIKNGDKIYVKEVTLSENEVNKKAWNHLFEVFLMSDVSLHIFQKLLSECPSSTVIDILGGKPTIQKILTQKNISRKSWDYHLTKAPKNTPMPTFADLIEESLHG